MQFNAILSSAAIAVMLSYLQPILIRLFWPSTCVTRYHACSIPMPL